MSDSADSEPRLEKWIKTIGTVVAPTTILAAALYYFGYVSSREQYKYFGVDVDALGLGPQEYIMRSPPTLFAPLLLVVVSALLLRQLDRALRKHLISRATPRSEEPTSSSTGPGAPAPTSDGAVAGTAEASDQPTGIATPLRGAGSFVRVVRGVGLLGLGVGGVLLLTHAYLRNWAPYDLVTPLVLAGGCGLLAYSMRLTDLLQAANAIDSPPGHSTASRRYGLLITAILACLFWAIATIAQASGLARAMETARNLDDLPSVILDTKENLYLHNPGMENQPTVLPASDDQSFRYRYRNLRLLMVGKDRMLLVPRSWSASASTLVVPLDGSVRVQFQFQNNPP